MAYITVHDKLLNMDWEYEKEYIIDLQGRFGWERQVFDPLWEPVPV